MDTVTVSIDQLDRLLNSILRNRGLAETDAATVARDYLEAELEGEPTHGLGKFLLIDSLLDRVQHLPEVISDTAGVTHLDGGRSLGQLCGQAAATAAVGKARENGIGMATIVNFSRFARLKYIGAMVANQGMMGIVLNNGGPPAVAPFGAAEALLGTNPLCLAFPRESGPFAIDFGTSLVTWGEIRQAILTGHTLPDNAFLDASGQYTVDPKSAEAVVPFGGPKGSALCVAIELLAGVVAGAKIGSAVESEYDLGALVIALQGKVVGGSVVEELLRQIAALKPMSGVSKVRAPGERSASALQERTRQGVVTIPESILRGLERMESGERVSIDNDGRMN